MHMNFKFWVKAIRTIPHVSKKEWDELDGLSHWLIATRFAVVTMTPFSVLVGTLLAVHDGYFDWLRFVLCLVGLTFAHATNNFLNDWTDSKTGVDKDNYFRTIYGAQPLEHKFWSERKHLFVTAINGAIALACGLALYGLVGSSILPLLIIGILLVLFYTWPLKWIGLGELSMFVVWGPLMIAGTYLVLGGGWDWGIAAFGAVFNLTGLSILLGKHTDKLKEDKAKHVHTLPVIIGEAASRWLVITLLALQPILTVVLVALGVVKWPVLLMLLAVPDLWRAIKVYSKPRPTKAPKGAAWPVYLAHTVFTVNRKVSSLFVLGLILSLFVK